MSRYCQLVIGPAGSGKSTYCHTIQKFGEVSRRTIEVINLDPAAENFKYNALADIRHLISIDDVMEADDLRLGPNGGLIFCMEHLAENFDWLREALGDEEDDYVLFDCPGQIELYSHSKVMSQLIQHLCCWNFRVCSVFIIDSQFLVDPFKYISAMMCALSSMINLEVSTVNILSKVDLLDKKSRQNIEDLLKSQGLQETIEDEEKENEDFRNSKLIKLRKSITSIVENFSLVQFIPLDITDESNIHDVLLSIDHSIQYGEDLEHKENRAQEFYDDNFPENYFDS